MSCLFWLSFRVFFLHICHLFFFVCFCVWVCVGGCVGVCVRAFTYQPLRTPCDLRSSPERLLKIPRVNLKSACKHSFHLTVPPAIRFYKAALPHSIGIRLLSRRQQIFSMYTHWLVAKEAMAYCCVQIIFCMPSSFWDVYRICNLSFVDLVFFCHELEQRVHNYLLHGPSSGILRMCPRKWS